MVFYLGAQQPEGAEQSRCWRNEDALNAECRGNAGSMNRACAAERHHDEIGRVAAALDRDGLDRPDHVRVCNGMDAVGGVEP